MNKKIVHDALILTAFTLVLGMLLGIVYEVTKEPIAAANLAAAQEAYKEVFEDADSFEALDGFDAEAATAVATENGYSDSIDDISSPFDNNALQSILMIKKCVHMLFHCFSWLLIIITFLIEFNF